MKSIIRVLFVILTFSIASVFAQDNSDRGQSKRELLKPVDAQKRSGLSSRHALELGSLEYFAKPGKFDVYEFDIDVLETVGQTITITPFNGPPIDIISYGIKRDPVNGWLVGKWTGEVVASNSKQTFPFELGIGFWAIGSDGSLIPPDRNREYALSQLNQEDSVIPKESYLRRNEKIVYAISGSMRLPHLQRQIEILQVGDELETLILYEIDIAKAIPPVSDTDEGPPDDTTEIGRERLRRLEAWEAHVEQLKRDLGLNQNQE